MRTTLLRAVSALLLLGSVGAAQAQSPPDGGPAEPVAGTDYVEIPNGSPLEPAEDQVVVEEFFNYICPACNAFEPSFLAWQGKLPPYVKVVHIPASFRADFTQYARAYYAAESFGLVERTHAAVYEAIHRARTLPAEGDRPDEEKIAAFYAKHGVAADEFLAAMRSFGTATKIGRATQHMQKSKVASTPSLVVNGRSHADMLRIATYLIEKERAANAG
jgi:protein dithiol oxidoreductase (disulfide-forming)